MKEGGEFSYKTMKYIFYDKYSKALAMESYTKETILHPAPLNFVTVWLIPLMLNKEIASSVGYAISQLNFWVQNLVYLFLFLLYEIIMGPIAGVKVFFNIIKIGTGNQKVYYCIVWFFLGWLFIIYYILKDTITFISLLCDYRIKDINKT
jgi:hypothetical protein